jgi:hypothetical protein
MWGMRGPLVVQGDEDERDINSAEWWRIKAATGDEISQVTDDNCS